MAANSNAAWGRNLEIDTAEISVIDNMDTPGPDTAPNTMRGQFDALDYHKDNIIKAVGTDGTDFDVSVSQGINGPSKGSMSFGLNKAMIKSDSREDTIDGSGSSGRILTSSNGHAVSGKGLGQEQCSQQLIKQPKIILVSFKVNHVTEIDVVSCTFNVSCTLFYHWEDQSLIEQKLPLGKISEKKLAPFSNPDIIVINNLTLVETSDYGADANENSCIELINSETGAVKMTKHVKGKVFLLSLDLQLFPFDCQNLSINLRCRKQDITECVLVYFSEESTVDAHPQHEWIFHGYSALTYTTLPQYSTTGKIYSSLHIVILVQRHSGWFINNIFLGFFVLTLVSWTSYALPEHLLQSNSRQYDIILLTLLLSICYKYVVGDKLPKVPYRTVVDSYIDISFACQIFGMLSAILRDWYVYSDEHINNNSSSSWLSIYPNLNRVLFSINCIMYAIFHVWLYIKLSNHAVAVNEWKGKALALNNTYKVIKNSPEDHDDSDSDEEQLGGLIRGVKASSGIGNSSTTTRGIKSSLAGAGLKMDFVTQNNLRTYSDAGFFANQGKKLETWGNGENGQQAVFSEEEEEELISIAQSGKHSPRHGGGKITHPTDCDIKTREKICKPSYINRLSAFQRTLALRAALGIKLTKYGLNAEYCRPSNSQRIIAGLQRSYTLNEKNNSSANVNDIGRIYVDNNYNNNGNGKAGYMIDVDEGDVHHVQSRVNIVNTLIGDTGTGSNSSNVNTIIGRQTNTASTHSSTQVTQSNQQRSSFSNGRANTGINKMKNPTMEFVADGYVMTND